MKRHQRPIQGSRLAALLPRRGLSFASIRGSRPLLLLLGLLCAAASQAATFTVSKTADTNDGACNADCSLREAIVAANGNGGADTIAFGIPISDPGFNAGTGVFTITITSPLPPVTGAGTTIDGTTQTANVGNTNPGMLGTGGTVGLGPDGVPGTGDELSLSRVAAPEIQIVDGAALVIGLTLQANNSTVRGIAIYGFGAGNTGDSNVFLANGTTGALIEQNVIGSGAAAFTDPGGGQRGWENIYSGGADNGTIRNNLIGYGGVRGILLAQNSVNWIIDDNEIRDNSLDDPFGDGLALDPGMADVTGNLITGSASQGIVVRDATGSTFTNNTISGNGVGIVSASGNAAGMTFRSTGSGHTVELNEFIANYAAGLSVNNGATGITISRNSFSANGTITARNGDAATGQIGIDLNIPGDDASAGTPPFVSLNDSGDTLPGGNNQLNYPVLESAGTGGGSLTLSGWARPGSVIELFIASADPTGFGEGETYLVTLTEGAAADTDAGSSAYGPGAINGLAQGTDNTNRFRFTVPTPAGVVGGTALTATARLATNTSEFSGIVTVVASQQISGRVFEDIAGDALTDGPIGGAGNPVYVGAGLALYRDDGDNIPEATDLPAGTTTTLADGSYTFSNLPAGVYWVTVDSSTLDSHQDPGAAASEIWSEQTFAPLGGWCADGSGTSSERLSAGVCYGGRLGNRSDNASSLDNAEHIARVVVAASDVGNLDFGFSFNVLTTVRGGDGSDDDPPAANGRTVQGSLVQFARNANSIAGANAMRFVPAEPTNASGSGQTWWRITATSAPPVGTYSPFIHLSDADTTIDGRAFDLTDGTSIRNTNTAAIGANETVGVAAAYATPSLDPELEIFNDASVLAIDRGIDVKADRNTLRHIAIYGFGTGALEADIFVGDNATTTFIDGVVIEDSVVGSGPVATADPGATGSRRRGIFVARTTNCILRRNIVRFVDEYGVFVALGSNGCLITENEIYDVGKPTNSDALAVTNSQVDVIGNLLGDAEDGVLVSASGIVAADNNTLRNNGDDGFTSAASGTATLTNNVIRNNGDLGLLLASSGNSATSNHIENNAGAGIQIRAGGNNNSLSQNRFGGNGGVAIDLVDAAITPGITPNTTAPPACGYDAGTLGNDGVDFPAITFATPTLVSGLACAAARVEVYRAAADGDFSDNTDPVGGSGQDHGEGLEYLGFATADAGTGVFNLTGITGLALGDSVTAIATDGPGNTSEFAANTTVTSGLVIQKRAFQLDGAPIANGATVPPGVEFKFMLYINNLGSALTDISIQDALDPLFAYQAGTIQVDNSLAACAVQTCTPAEEGAIFASAVAAPILTDAVDADAASYTPSTIEVGDQNVANARLDIAGARVLAVLFSAKVQ